MARDPGARAGDGAPGDPRAPMAPEVQDLHRRAAEAAGRDSACGRKVDHGDEGRAWKAAGSLNRRNAGTGDPKRFEPYPCPFCGGWHVGREMTEAELRAAAAEGEA